MRYLLSLVVLALLASQSHASLVISGVFDVIAGTPKGVELYVLEDIADLSLYGIGVANNGDGSDGQEFTFPADAASKGDYLYVTTGLTAFVNFFGFSADYAGGIGVNGDDAIELYQSGSVIDVFGDTSHAGSPAWDYAEGWAYRSDNTGPDGSTFVSSSWSTSPGGLDAGTNALSSTPMPIGTYQAIPEPSACLSIGAVALACFWRRPRR